MTNETRLMIKNQMVTNELLILVVASLNNRSIGPLTVEIANKLDIITDKTVINSNEFSRL